MLSTVSVTSGKIYITAESKLTSLIGMAIFNNGLQFRMGEDETLNEMISAVRNVSIYYKLLERETVQGTLLDNCFDKNIKNQRDKLLNGAEIYGLHFQGDGAKIKDTPLLNIFTGGVYLPVSAQKIMDCTGRITCGHKRYATFVAEIFFDTMNDLNLDKQLVDLHMFDGSSVCRKAQKYLRLSILFCHILLE